MLDHVFIVVNAFNATFKLAKEALEALQTHYPEYLLPTIIRQCTKFAQASSEGRPVFVADPDLQGRHGHPGRRSTNVLPRWRHAAALTERHGRPAEPLLFLPAQSPPMKKAFEQNVSRAKPRLRLGALTGLLDPERRDAAGGRAQPPEPPPRAHRAAAPDLSAEVRARIERARAPRPAAAEAMDAPCARRRPPQPPWRAALAEPDAARPRATGRALPPREEPDYGGEDEAVRDVLAGRHRRAGRRRSRARGPRRGAPHGGGGADAALARTRRPGRPRPAASASRSASRRCARTRAPSRCRPRWPRRAMRAVERISALQTELTRR